jgi:UDP-N-acetylmuramoylalanine--D-glutamate ligase
LSAAAGAWDPASDVRGKRVLVYSLGIEGRDLARWFLARGARVTMSDTRTEAQLAAAGAAAPDGVERVVAGQPLLDPAGFAILAVSQSILRHDPAVVAARAAAVPITSQMQLFLQLCPGSVIGITGSSGKSTTTALVGAMAAAAAVKHVVGGNIGEALLGRLDEMEEDTTVILEISHTQLQYTDRSPRIAAVTNVTPNHLDQFSSDEYVGLKRNILRYQGRGDIAVVNADDQTSRAIAASAKGRLAWASALGEVQGDGAWLDRDSIMVRSGHETARVMGREEVRIRGAHNLSNVVMACAIASAAGWPAESMRAAAATFRGVAHRLEVVGSAGGATWVNDSIATSPERTCAGLLAFEEPVVLLLGGRHKNLPLDRLQRLAAQRCRAVVCFGEAGPLFYDALRSAVADTSLVTTLEDAVCAARKVAREGDVVLLAPAGTSFDAYPNFEARGEEFRRLVRAIPGFEEVAP